MSVLELCDSDCVCLCVGEEPLTVSFFSFFSNFRALFLPLPLFPLALANCNNRLSADIPLRVGVDVEIEVEKEVVSRVEVSLLHALTSAPALSRLLIDSDIPF